MTTTLLNNLLHNRQKRLIAIISFLFAMTLITIAVDFLEATFQNSGFYISESLLFSSFWIIFLPLLQVQFFIAKRIEFVVPNLITAITLIAFHLTLYPIVVWLLSKLFYHHTFSCWQTFRFGVTAYFFQATLLYTIPLASILLFKNRSQNIPPSVEETAEPKTDFVASLIVTEPNNQKVSIQIEDIFYFSAAPPYIAIYHKNKKYLYSATLKSLSSQLDNKVFVRVHKSVIVNLHFVSSYKSRLNGDYDLTLKDGTEIRVSRNYAAAFKSNFQISHHLTTN